MKSFALTAMGKVRDLNEDAVFACDETIGNLNNLYIVADGMGGHQAGEYASAYAIARTRKLVEKHQELTPEQLLEWIYSKVNEEIYDKGTREESKTGMGTTLVSCTIDQGRMVVANVGDSRLYVCHENGTLIQITKDHSYVEEMVRKGEMRRGSEEYWKAKNMITRAIGALKTVETDTFQLELEEGDQVLICSDGLSNMITDETMAQILSLDLSLKEKAELMVEKANSAGGQDNISVVLVAPFACGAISDKSSQEACEATMEQGMRGL